MSKGTARRTVRIEDELWDAAKTKAEAEGTDLSNIIRGALRGYLEEPAQD
ncbi:hypothetical protein KKR91_01355 [Arthrobacter jiangjiafuii]|uniref:Uncharacterized protein n=1 Tax=Arthrobacter jiangjiafuii TaxID=2817475 RepID=A0A975M6H1_9MICC|nr:hypothetical protein [Arthrobacter jiangjiafuii]MBP3044845.1 hypothetical protein [Arthrobacter jiangjiafuii]QWC10331.1 hypothetical protein KKR91_01355 [Arthrobacter jiangjiafuii]